MHVSLAIQPARSSRRTYTPVLAPLLDHAPTRLWIVLFAVGHLALAASGVPTLACPIRSLTGLECPGCGLTHGCLDLLRGRWQASASANLFAPIFLLLILLFAITAVVPGRWRVPIIHRIRVIEERTAIMFLFGAALIGYWFVR